MTEKPIESQKEANDVRLFLANTLVKQLNISLAQALLRVEAFNKVQDKLMERYKVKSPNDLMYQVIVDIAMEIPQL